MKINALHLAINEVLVGTVSTQACNNMRDPWWTKESLSTRTSNTARLEIDKGGWEGSGGEKKQTLVDPRREEHSF